MRNVRQGVRHADWTLASLVAAGLALVAAIALLTGPAVVLLGESPHAVAAALHGTVAAVQLIVATVCAYLAYILYVGNLERLRDLRILSTVQAVLALGTIVLGNWIYVAYRAVGGPRTRFLETRPEIHQVFFEFKEYIALFTLPLAAAAAFVLRHRGDAIRDEPALRQVVAVLLGLSWVALLVAFGLGAAITKLGSV